MAIRVRIAAAAIASVAWTGLVTQCVVLYQQNSSLWLTLWIVLGYFTITTNVLVGLVFSGVAANRNRFTSSSWVAGTMLSILLVGIIYALLLHGLTELSGGSALANSLLHWWTPALVPLYWIFFTPKGSLAWSDPLFWATYPLAYFCYALVRGTATGKYAYPFMDVLTLGWQQTLLNAASIAAIFLLCAFAIVWIDHQISLRVTSFPRRQASS